MTGRSLSPFNCQLPLSFLCLLPRSLPRSFSLSAFLLPLLLPSRLFLSLRFRLCLLPSPSLFYTVSAFIFPPSFPSLPPTLHFPLFLPFPIHFPRPQAPLVPFSNPNSPSFAPAFPAPPLRTRRPSALCSCAPRRACLASSSASSRRKPPPDPGPYVHVGAPSLGAVGEGNFLIPSSFMLR